MTFENDQGATRRLANHAIQKLYLGINLPGSEMFQASTLHVRSTMLARQFFRASNSLTTSYSKFFPPIIQKRVNIAKMSSSSVPSLKHIAIDSEEGIAVIKYNRPKNGNALNTLMLKVGVQVSHSTGVDETAHINTASSNLHVQDILAGLQWAEQDDNTRVIITTGEGKFYTAGKPPCHGYPERVTSACQRAE